MSWFVTCLDGVISLTKVGLQLVGDRYPGIQKKPSRVICHGHYRDIYSQSISREAARKILGIDANSAVILFFGQIRPYKGVVGLVEAFREIQMPGVELVIAGRIKNAELAKEIESASAEDPRVRVYDQFVPETKVSQFFSAADLVVLPYTEILNSGSAILALSLDRPVLVPDLGSMRELRSLVGDQWIRTFNGKLTAGELLDAISWATSNAERNQKPVLTEWKDIARETKEFFEMILANG
ncbi:MAG: glycosyltransferase [Firmicutes bacterium]|nr:glycosyltransferase [Bacillota bacterium]